MTSGIIGVGADYSALSQTTSPMSVSNTNALVITAFSQVKQLQVMGAFNFLIVLISFLLQPMQLIKINWFISKLATAK
jgi:hypothetical protein